MYSTLGSTFAVDFFKLWDIEKHFFIVSLVKMLDHLPESISTLEKDRNFHSTSPYMNSPESLTLDAGAQLREMSSRTMEYEKNQLTVANSAGSKNQGLMPQLFNKCNNDSFYAQSNEMFPSDPNLLKYTNIKKMKDSDFQFFSSYYETAFRKIYPTHQGYPGRYLMPFTLVMMESSPGVPIGIKIFTYSAIASCISGMFMPVDPLFWKTNEISKFETSSSSSRVSGSPANLQSYFEVLDWDYFNKFFDLKTVGDCYQFEMHFDRKHLASGHEIYFQSLDTIVDFSSFDI